MVEQGGIVKLALVIANYGLIGSEIFDYFRTLQDPINHTLAEDILLSHE